MENTKEEATRVLKTETKLRIDTCALCDKPSAGGAILLCKKHWDVYSVKAQRGLKNKVAFKEFQRYRKKIQDGLIKHREI